MIPVWLIATIVGGAVAAGALTISALVKVIKRKVSWRAQKAVIKNIAKYGKAYHIRFVALDSEGEITDEDTVEAKRIASDIYEGRTMYL